MSLLTSALKSFDLNKVMRNFFIGPEEDRNAPSPVVGHPSQMEGMASLSQWLPYDQYESSTGLYFNLDSIGLLFEVTPQTGADEQMEERLKTLLNPLPADTCLQWMLFGGPMSHERLEMYLDHRRVASDQQENNPLFLKLAEKRIAYFRNSKGRGLFEGDHFAIRDFRLILSITRAGTQDDHDTIEEMVDLLESLKSALYSAALPAKSMTPSDFLTFMKPILDPRILFNRTERDEVRYDPGQSLRDQMGSIGMPVGVTSKSMIWGAEDDVDGEEQVSARVFTVRSYPQTKRLWEMAEIIGALYDDTLQYPCPFLITQGVQIQNRASNEEGIKIKGGRAQMNAESKMAKFQTELKDINQDFQHMQTHINNGGQQVLMYHNLVLFAPTKKIRRYEATVDNIWTNQRFKIVRADAITAPMFVASLPMALTPKVAKSLVRPAKVMTRKTDQNAINCAPVLGEWNGSGDPVLLYFGKRGTPTFLDFYSNTTGNYNFAMTGVSGAGKSVHMNEIVCAYRSMNAIGRIVDIGRSYENLVKMLGGTFLEFKRAAMPCLNPFTWIGADSEFSFQDEMRILKPMYARMASPTVALSSFQLALLESAITEVWEDYGNRAEVDLVAKKLFSVKNENGGNERQAYELATQLFPFTRAGQFGRVFNGAANVRLDGDLVALELEELSGVPDLQRVVMFAITSLVTYDMYQRPRSLKKLFVLDEGWQVLGKDEDSAGFLEEGFRRARKYEGIFGVGTQGIQDYFNSPAGLACYSNADWKLYGRQDNDVLEKLAQDKTINFEPAVMRMIKQLRKVDGKYSEWLITSPEGKSVVKCVLDPFFLTMASTKGPIHQRVQHYIQDQGMSQFEAISRVVKEQGYDV